MYQKCLKLLFKFLYRFLVGTVELLMVDLANGHIEFIYPGLMFAKIGGGGIMGKAPYLCFVGLHEKNCRPM